MRIERFLELVDGVKRSGDHWMAKCPAHDDSTPSLSIGEGRDGRVLIKCHSGGCSFESIVSALGLEPSDLFEESAVTDGVTLPELSYRCGIASDRLASFGLSEGVSKDGFPCVHIPYRDGLGNEVGVKTRLHLEKGGGPKFVWSKNSEHAIPYGLWRKPPRCDVLFVCEGESDTWTMWDVGMKAIGIPGATSFKCLTEHMLGGVGRVVVSQDRNAPGIAFAAAIAHICERVGVPCTVFAPPEPYIDVTQWRCAVGDERFKFAISAILKMPTGDPRAVRIDELDQEPNRFLIYPILPLREVTLLAGAGGSGKSTLAYTIASILSRRGSLSGMQTVKARTLIISREDGIGKDIKPKLIAAGADMDYIRAYDFPRAGNLPVSSKAFAVAVSEAAKLANAKLVIVDPVVSFFGEKGDLNSANEVRAWIQPLIDAAVSSDLALMLVMHHNKSGGIFGSIDFINAARSIIQIHDDPSSSHGDNVYCACHTKANRTALSSPLRFRVIGSSDTRVVTDGEEEAIEQMGTQRIEWLGRTHLTAAEIEWVKPSDRETVRDIARWVENKVTWVTDEEELMRMVGERFQRTSRTLRLVGIKCSNLERQHHGGAYAWSPAGTL